MPPNPRENLNRIISRLRTSGCPGSLHLVLETHATCAHRVASPRFSICLRGEACYRVIHNGQPAMITVKRGDAIYAAPGAMMDLVIDSDYEALGVILYPHMTHFMLAKKRRPRRPEEGLGHRLTLLHDSPASLAPDERTLCTLLEGSCSRPADDPYVRGLFALLLIRAEELMRETADPADRGKARFTWQSASQFIADHLHAPLSRSQVAESLRLHPNHVSRLCRQYTGRSYQDYVLGLRLQRAHSLLKDSQLNINEIALLCGFTDAGYFSRCYRKAHGVPPGRDRL